MVPYSSRLKRIASIPPYWLTRYVYRIQLFGAEHLPASGGVVLVGNHVSFVDVMVLQAALPRAIRYLGATWLFERWWLRPLMRCFDVLPVSSRRPREAIRRATECLRAGEVVCLFPEGGISKDGRLKPFRLGFALMARQADAPVVPFYIDGLWGSVFSYHGGRFFWKLPRSFRPEVRLRLGPPLGQGEMDTESAHRRVLALKAELESDGSDRSGGSVRSNRSVRSD